MTAPDRYQTEVARIALAAASAHGFALAGGQALIAHGIVSRPTVDIDLFTDLDQGVRAAKDSVAAALSRAGYAVEEIVGAADLGGVFDDFDRHLIEFEVRHGDRVVRLQLVRFDRGRQPVTLDIGPVLHLDDVIGTKVAALATRAEPRDFIDVAAALDRYHRDRLVALATQADPALTPDEIGDAMRRLDRMPDEVFRLYGLHPGEISAVRAAFTAWPR